FPIASTMPISRPSIMPAMAWSSTGLTTSSLSMPHWSAMSTVEDEAISLDRVLRTSAVVIAAGIENNEPQAFDLLADRSAPHPCTWGRSRRRRFLSAEQSRKPRPSAPQTCPREPTTPPRRQASRRHDAHDAALGGDALHRVGIGQD